MAGRAVTVNSSGTTGKRAREGGAALSRRHDGERDVEPELRARGGRGNPDRPMR